MPDIIKLLPDSVANQIAAGEVIQRPASVVKELVENAIDAGASRVEIIIKDAGRTLIQVLDNGCGMSPTDARMAFERHATSKIRVATDLFSLHTMGFRGEALPSIAAVSEIDIRTQRADDTTGTRLIINASDVESQEAEICATGTNIMVKRLFFNLPARRKFLKKDTIELGHILREFERLALVNTGVEFSITHNDVVLHHLMPAPLKQRIADLFGKSLEQQLLPVSTETSIVKITGFVSHPEHARKRNALQFFFVNGRNMRHPYFHKAVISCFDRLVAADTQPNYFLNFTVDPDTIDVNIHPQKHEIKFENEQPVWQILTAAVREALGRFNPAGALDFDNPVADEIPVYNPQTTAPTEVPGTGYDPNFNPFTAFPEHEAEPARTPSQMNALKSAVTDWEKLYAGFEREAAADIGHVRGSRLNGQLDKLEIEQEAAPAEMPSLINADARPRLLQVKGRYIVSTCENGLLLIDQHRAHTLVLYNRYLENVQKGEVSSQRLIFPETLQLDAQQAVVLLSVMGTLEDMGFDISDLGDRTYAINAIPAMLGRVNPAEAVSGIIAAVNDEDEDIETSQWQRIALSLAKLSAVRYGAYLSETEMDTLISDLFHLPTPNYTPDGQTTLARLSLADLAKYF